VGEWILMKIDDASVAICFHCGNETLMVEVASHAVKETDNIGMDDYGDPLHVVQFHSKWDLLMCPVCKDVTLYRRTWCSEDGPYDEPEEKILFPYVTRKSGNIPPKIYSAYSAAIKVRRIDGAICALSLRRTLEMMCKDRGVEGYDLYTKLKQLSDEGVLPPILSEMGDILKLLGNAAAHGDDAEFDEDVVLAIVDFTQIILDYVYNIPASLRDVQQKITDKGFRKSPPNKTLKQTNESAS
jgi:hypothetical protein